MLVYKNMTISSIKLVEELVDKYKVNKSLTHSNKINVTLKKSFHCIGNKLKWISPQCRFLIHLPSEEVKVFQK